MEQGSSIPPDCYAILKSAPDLYLILDPKTFNILEASDAYLKATLVQRENILGRNVFDVFPDNPANPSATGVNNLKNSLGKVVANKIADKMAVQKYDIRTPSNTKQFEQRYWSPINCPVLNDDRELIYIIHRVEDVTESDSLKTALAEKESLMKEIHHRVKNNLQIISALLNLQAKQIHDDKTKKIFTDNAVRVRNMSMIHDMLYQSESIAQVKMKHYVNMLWKYLSEIYNIQPSRIKFFNDVDDLFLDINIAIPCGLIINELLTNIFKHAFPENAPGTINISLKEKDGIGTLIISDNGCGIEPETNIQKLETLGLKLVTNIANQIKGKMSINHEHGSSFHIKFPLT